MAEKIFIGVDGGGTKCKARVEDINGNLLGQASDGPANISISVDGSWQSINKAVRDALAVSGISLNNSRYEFYAGFGLAGTEVPKAVHDFLAKSYPFTRICLKSDAYAACLGAHDGADGAIIIIGTGVVGLIVEHKKHYQVSGWGFPHSDEGGGAWLGLQVLRLATQAYDGRLKSTPMLDAVLGKFDNDIYQLASWAIGARSNRFGELAPIVVEYANKKDTLALQLMQQAGAEIDRIFHALEQSAGKSSVRPYSLFGGVSHCIEPWLSTELRAHLVPRKYDATRGAILMIKQELGL